MICPQCGDEFELADTTIKQRIKRGTPRDLCKKCVRINQNKKQSETMKKLWNNKSEEEKEIHKQKVSKGLIEYWNNLTEEEYANHVNKVDKGIKNHWDEYWKNKNKS